MPPRRLDDPDLTLADLMARWPQTVPVFLRYRMLCVGCPVTPFHTVADACAEYGLDPVAFRAALRDAVDAGGAGPQSAEAAGPGRPRRG